MVKRNNQDKKLLNLLTLSKKRLEVFRKLPVNEQGFALLDLSKYIQKKIISQLDIEETIKMLHYLDPDMVVDLLQCLDKKTSRNIIKKLNEDIKKKVEFLLKFNPRTAAGLMNLNYIEVDKNLTIKEVSKMVQEYEEKKKKFPEILVVEDGFLSGELEGHSLFSRLDKKIENYVKKIPSIKYNKSEKEVIKLFREKPNSQIVVLDKDESILGIIYSDDILKLINKETGQSLYSFAGLKKEEDIYDPAFLKIKNRYKWLIINLATAFLAALVVSLFEKTISSFVLLAVYMPIVAGMGGNAGVQTLAVVVRGLALREIEFKTVRKIIFNELATGAVNGLIIGVLAAIIAILFNKNPLFGLILGIAMIINLMVAGLFGSIVPLIMKKLGRDPASSATVFITTATDVFGFFVFLGMATLLL